MAGSETFLLRYDGDALRDHTIEADDLASALLGLSEFIEEGNRVINGDRSSIRLRVRATEPGCFQVLIAVDQSFVDLAVDLLSRHEVTALSTLLALLGISFKDGVLGVIEIVRRLRGKKPRAIKALGARGVEITLADGSQVIVTNRQWEIISSKRARAGLYRVVMPLEKPGIDTVQILEGREPRRESTIRVAKAEVDDFRPPEEIDEELQTSERVTFVSVVGLWVSGGHKWRFSEGGNEFPATISDDIFLSQLKDDQVPFHPSDLFEVRLHQTQYRKQGELKSVYEVRKVIRQIKRDQQLSLGMQGNASEVLELDE